MFSFIEMLFIDIMVAFYVIKLVSFIMSLKIPFPFVSFCFDLSFAMNAYQRLKAGNFAENEKERARRLESSDPEISVQRAMLDRFTPPGYQSSFSPRDQRLGGGITLYVKETCCANPLGVSYSSAEYLGLIFFF